MRTRSTKGTALEVRALLPLVVVSPLAFAFALAEEEAWNLKTPAPVAELRPGKLAGANELECAECHAAVVEEWATSAHALAWVDEDYQEALEGRKRPESCHACHIPQPLLAGELPKRPKARAEDLHAGVSCDSCHLGPKGEMLGATGTQTDAHPTLRSEQLTEAGSNELCAVCHRMNIGPVVGVAKDFERSKQAERGRSCVACHLALVDRMPSTEGSTQLAAARKVRSHALQTPRDPAFMRRAFEPSLRTDGGKTYVVIANRAGHRVPGLKGREVKFRARLLDASGSELAVGERSLDVRRFLPVDGTVEIEIAGTGSKVHLTALHVDPRRVEPIPFLDMTLPEGR